jgi:hypothetical protein
MAYCKLQKRQAIDNTAIREFYSVLKTTIMRAKSVSLLKMIVNEQSLAAIMVKMPAADWKQWAMDRTNLIQGMVEAAFEKLVEQKWKDALNIAAAGWAGWGSFHV